MQITCRFCADGQAAALRHGLDAVLHHNAQGDDDLIVIHHDGRQVLPQGQADFDSGAEVGFEFFQRQPHQVIHAAGPVDRLFQPRQFEQTIHKVPDAPDLARHIVDIAIVLL
ncbi:MAG: hypothetical protein BWY83_01170 [bacterium ADurb.Bin478]|nr:MAG: hypothetical protein BWY83_01170 [bacterium ADurb.Bin478]